MEIFNKYMCQKSQRPVREMTKKKSNLMPNFNNHELPSDKKNIKHPPTKSEYRAS